MLVLDYLLGEGSRLMSNVGRNVPTASATWIWGLLLGVFCLWLPFSWTALGNRAEESILNFLPGWFVVGNLLLAPCLMVFAAGPWRIAQPLRLMFAALTLGSIVIAEITFRRFVLASCASLGVLLLEAYWIIPSWNARQRR